ncbi:hypothetical protein FRC01_002745 [Tulasnella sp. 417]|nr:hypothetical protein FRC01_002745 [Tulasnella sp. 417]
MSRLYLPSTSRSPARDGGETTSMDEYSDATSSSPLSPDSPTQQLILLQEPDDLPELELWQSDDENEEELGADLEGGRSRPRSRRQRSEDALGGAALMRGATGVIAGRTAGLTGTQIFTYLISPTLKFGATSLLNQTLRSPSTDNHDDDQPGSQNELFPLPVPLAVLALFFAAVLNALAVQIWLMLGQYLRRWSFEGVVGEAFVGFAERRHGTRRNPWKRAVVRTTKVLVVLSASLLCAAYLRESTDLLVPLVPKNSYTFERVGVALVLGFLLVPFFTGKATLNSKRIIYSNLLSIVLYIVVGGVVIAHRYQVRADNGANAIGTTTGQERLAVRGPLKVHLTGGAWEWLDVALFTFANQFFTFPLFLPFAQAVARRRAQKEADARARSVQSVSSPLSPSTARRNKRKLKQANALPTLEFFFLSLIASLFSVLLLSLPFFLGTEPLPAPSPKPPTDDPFTIRSLLTLPAYIERTYNALRVLQAAYLLLGIPPLWLSIVKPRLTSTSVSFRWVQDIKWHWVLFVSLVSLASFAPSSLAHFTSRSASLCFIGFSFLLPALLHVTVHTVRSPLSIIYPTSSASGSADRNGTGMTESEEALLRKKERSLQKRRFIRRAGWDLAVWFLLLPVGAVKQFIRLNRPLDHAMGDKHFLARNLLDVPKLQMSTVTAAREFERTKLRCLCFNTKSGIRLSGPHRIVLPLILRWAMHGKEGKLEKLAQWRLDPSLIELSDDGPEFIGGHATVSAGFLAHPSSDQNSTGKSEEAVNDEKEQAEYSDHPQTKGHEAEGKRQGLVPGNKIANNQLKPKSVPSPRDGSEIAAPRDTHALLLVKLGLLHNHQDNRNEALKSYSEALGIYTNNQNHLGRAVVLQEIAEVHREYNEYGAAASCLAEALRIYTHMGREGAKAETLCDLASLYIAAGRNNDVMPVYRKALEIYATLDDARGRAKVLKHIARIYLAQGKYGEAISHHSEVLQVYTTLDDSDGKAAALCDIASVYEDQGRYHEAIERYLEALQLFVNAPFSSSKAQVLARLGEVYRSQKKYEEAKINHSEALKIYTSIGRDSARAVILCGLGRVYNAQGDHKAAMSAYSEALQISTTLQHANGKAAALVHVADAYLGQAKNGEAISHYNEALSLYDSLGDSESRAQTLFGLASAYENQGKYDEATTHYSDALQLYVAVRHSKRRADALARLGAVFCDHEKFDKAILSYSEALKTYTDMGKTTEKAEALYGLGNVYRDQGEYEDGISHYREALEIYESLGDSSGKADTLQTIAMVWYHQSDLGRAISLLEQLAKIFGQLGKGEDEAICLKEVAFMRGLISASYLNGSHLRFGDSCKSYTGNLVCFITTLRRAQGVVFATE